MNEREFEQILIEHPELIEEGIIFKGNQVNLDGKKLDLLFEDKNGQKLIIELKLIARRKDIAQLIDYAGYFIEKERAPVRTMLVALRIPANYRYSFDYFGFEYKEITEDDLSRVSSQAIEKRNFCEPPTLLQKEEVLTDINTQTSSLIENQKLSQSERNLTRQNMASRIKNGSLFGQARHAIELLKSTSGPVTMKEIVDYMKSMNYKSRSYYDLFNALCDSGLVVVSAKGGRKAYMLADD